jgi:arabinofuranosyltransferase
MVGEAVTYNRPVMRWPPIELAPRRGHLIVGATHLLATPRHLGLAMVVVGCAVFAGALLVNAWHSAVIIDGQRYHALRDDAMISMRYAYNMAQGDGLVWNAGEYVQGFTNLGWTLVMAALFWLGASLGSAPLIVRSINVGLHVAIVALVFGWSWRRGRPIQAFVAAFLVAVDGSLLAFSMGGFEVTAQALLITAAGLSLFDRQWSATAPVWAALAVLMRPDSIVVFAWVAGCLLLRFRRREGSRRDVAALAVGGVVVAALFVFQRLYYGDWLPNTLHLKAPAGAASVREGLAYLRSYALAEYFSLPLLLSPLALVVWRLAAGDPPLTRVVGLLASWTLYVVAVGGDAFAHGRFFAPIVPLLALCAGVLVEDLTRALGRGRIVAALAASLVVLGLGAHVAPLWRGRLAAPRFLSVDSVNGICLAWALRHAPLPRDAVIAVYFAGTLPYYMPGYRFHDVLGKSDRVIAQMPARAGPPGHSKWDYAYSLGLVRPAVIVTAAPFDGADEAVYRAHVAFHPALWLDPIFRSEYRRVAFVHNGEPATTHQWVYARRDVAFSSALVPEGTCAATLGRRAGSQSGTAETPADRRGASP